MYRSGPIRQKDYKIFHGTIDVLNKKEFKACWTFRNKLSKDWEAQAESVIEISTCLKGSFDFESAPTPLLITKILLGTMGCTPAYDRFFCAGLKKVEMTQAFGKKSYLELMEFYYENRDEIRNARKATVIEYPIMKLLDMYFWSLGYNS